MKKVLPYKSRNIILLTVSIVVFFCVYQLFISPITQDIEKTEELYAKLVSIQSAPSHIEKLENEIKKASALLGKDIDYNTSFQQKLLELTSEYCKKHQLTLIQFHEPKVESKNDFLIETNQFEVKGKFKDLLQLIYLFEQKERVGKIASVKFKKKKNLNTKEEFLSVNIYIQNIKRNG